MKLAVLVAALAFAQETEAPKDVRDQQIQFLQTEVALYQRLITPCAPAILASQVEAQARAQMAKPKPPETK